jgi:hypothetical protein
VSFALCRFVNFFASPHYPLGNEFETGGLVECPL